MVEINGKPFEPMAKLFASKVVGTHGHILLTGYSGSGKSILLEHLIKNFPADFHNRENLLPPSALQPEVLFINHDTAVIDAGGLMPDCLEVLETLLRTCRRKGRRIILSVMTATDVGKAIDYFQTHIQLERLPKGEGIGMTFTKLEQQRRIA
ncbi:hypothetical protein AGJ34_20795 [Cronobacter dublinensis subsp. dublinensis]|nr:hypothetical protein [Cronobacter dublinensis subsp. dublinensis]EGT5729714.1 hypothetical protein [Cronobacter dublinensis subsp. dublinensis]